MKERSHREKFQLLKQKKKLEVILHKENIKSRLKHNAVTDTSGVANMVSAINLGVAAYRWFNGNDHNSSGGFWSALFESFKEKAQSIFQPQSNP